MIESTMLSIKLTAKNLQGICRSIFPLHMCNWHSCSLGHIDGEFTSLELIVTDYWHKLWEDFLHAPVWLLRKSSLLLKRSASVLLFEWLFLALPLGPLPAAIKWRLANHIVRSSCPALLWKLLMTLAHTTSITMSQFLKPSTLENKTLADI